MLVELWFAFSQTLIYGVEFLITSIIALRAKRLLLAVPLLIATALLFGCAAWHAMQPLMSRDSEILALLFQGAVFEAVIVLGSVAVIRAAGYRLVSRAEAAAEGELPQRLNSAVGVAAEG